MEISMGLSKGVRTAALGLAFGVSAVAAQAQDYSDYPTSQIRMIIPYSPGGATDIIFRLFANEAEEHLGVPIVPINMAGASATLGSREVRDAAPDGYTLLASHEVIAAARIAGVVDYSFDAFEPVSLITQTPNMATINSGLGIETLEEFKAHLEENPGSLTWGITPGSTSHFFAAMMLESLGLEQTAVRFIDYEGTGDAITAVQRGEIAGTMTNYASARSQVEEGIFVPIAVAHDERLPQLPDVPTFNELGFDMVHSTSRGFFAPAGTPEPIIARLAEAFEAAARSEALQQRIEDDLGSIVRFLPPEDQRAFFQDAEERLLTLSDLLQM